MEEPKEEGRLPLSAELFEIISKTRDVRRKKCWGGNTNLIWDYNICQTINVVIWMPEIRLFLLNMLLYYDYVLRYIYIYWSKESIRICTIITLMMYIIECLLYNGMYSYRLYNIKLRDPHNILCSRQLIDHSFTTDNTTATIVWAEQIPTRYLLKIVENTHFDLNSVIKIAEIESSFHSLTLWLPS
ncbi:hypothetical protein AGLY_001021 [Aphis glycines]|uniref:Uncharacterized protein n=1 Tax=Aphis glycines TaxID=307491 RepID=A0A6G0U8M9_APHGL|nr:hypothetical protein AGLY_001021 [Aphis glycines]